MDYREQQKQARERYKLRHPGRAIALGRQRKFGITPEDYETLLENQNNCCALCGKPEVVTWKGKVKQLAVDHDHSTGLVRSLLCQKCNTGLGSFNDSEELLEKAIKYLRSYKA